MGQRRTSDRSRCRDEQARRRLRAKPSRRPGDRLASIPATSPLWRLAIAAWTLVALSSSPSSSPFVFVRADSIPDAAEYVLLVSIDGLMPHATHDAQGGLPNFDRLREEGSWTENARNDYSSSQTVPTHLSMFTGRNVDDHGYFKDHYGDGVTVDGTVQNIFNLVSDDGGRTCMIAAKSKFEFFLGWSIDTFHIEKEGSAITALLRDEMTGAGEPCRLAFVHYRDADKAGHRNRGVTDTYHESVRDADGYLGDIFSMVENSNILAGKTAIIVTTDHGFAEHNHKDYTLLLNYRIPLYVWGPNVSHGSNLYTLNPDTKADPLDTRPDNEAVPPPLRCHDVGPMAADFLGIKPTFGWFSRQDVRVNAWYNLNNVTSITTTSAAPPGAQNSTSSSVSGGTAVGGPPLRTRTTTVPAAPLQPSTTAANVVPSTPAPVVPVSGRGGCVLAKGGCKRHVDCCSGKCKKKEKQNGKKVKLKKPYCRG